MRVVVAVPYGWCGETLCQERDANDNPIRRYLPEGEVDLTNNTLLLYGRDRQGSVRSVLALPSGQTLNGMSYDPYGNMVASISYGSAATATDIRYAGLFYNAATGLYLSATRAYDPVLGRWLSRDPIEEDGGLTCTHMFRMIHLI